MTVMSNYKAEHEEFVSNLNGSSTASVIICLAHVPALILLTKLVQKGKKPRLFFEFLFFSFPMLLCMTIFADYSMISLSIILLTAGLLYQGKKVVACADGFFVSASERPSMTGNKSENRKIRASYLTLSKGDDFHKSYISLFIFIIIFFAIEINNRCDSDFHMHRNSCY